MRLLRGLASRILPCGCLVGIYETYGRGVIASVDVRGAACERPDHRLHAVVDLPRGTPPASARARASA